MSTTLNVSLFLPYTIAFHDTPSNSPEKPSSRKNDQHRSSSDLATRMGHVSLLDQPPLPTPPKNDALFGHDGSGPDQFSPKSSLRLLQNLKHLPESTTSTDKSAVGRGGPHLSDWGTQAIFNQPQSRAGPAPSRSILDFAKAHDDLEAKRRAQGRSRLRRYSTRSTPRSRSQEKIYENRPWSVEPALHGNGGLISAVCGAADEGLLHTTWIGTVGFPTDSLSASLREDIHDKLLNEHDSVVVYPRDKDVDGHYAHYCKTILWPIFHYQVPDHPKSKAYADHSWQYYRRVNEAFADATVLHYKQGDVIWIHDYHLLLVPGLVRQKLPDAPIGIFLHTAFPSSEVFRCLATRKELLDGMLGADLIAFQTDEYAGHFLQTCRRLLTVEATSEGVQLESRFVNVIAEPIGINPVAIREAKREPAVQKWIDVIRERYKNKKIIVARDKLDSVHGVRQKLLAYELFLNKHPEWSEKVVLIQVATSASEQSDLMTVVSDICTRIDSVHSTLATQPLVFLKQDIALPQYLALLSIADVFDDAALRDGMGLGAYEYITCQDGHDGSNAYGPLILSEFTGSHTLLGKSALSINPWDYKQHAERIKRALEMTDQEKKDRWQHLDSIVGKHTGARWISQLHEMLIQVHGEHRQRACYAVPRLNLADVEEKYKAAEYRVFIIDYEGTLAPHRTSSGDSLASLRRVISVLTDLMADSRNVVYVMSGRSPEELERVFAQLPSVGLVAENGCFLREYGASGAEWQEFVDAERVSQWKDPVRAILDYYKDRIEGSDVEERHCSLFFRYDKAEDQDAAIRHAGDCADQINSSCQSMQIHAVPISKAVLVEHVDYSKGTAAVHIFDGLRSRIMARHGRTADFMLVAGDDREDEVIFQWANDLGREEKVQHVYTISVGRRNTVAQATLTHGATGLLKALQKLARLSFEGQPDDYINVHRSLSFME